MIRRVGIRIEQGLVDSVYCSDPSTEVLIVEFDKNNDNEESLVDIIDTDGKPTKAFVDIYSRHEGRTVHAPIDLRRWFKRRRKT